MFERFTKDRSGSFAVTTALMILPLILMVGFGIDGSRYYNARTHLQDAVDMAALALAASPEQDMAKLRADADKFIIANLSTDTVENIKVSALAADVDTIKLTVTGQIHTTFMKLADFDVMAVAATTLAMRAPVRAIEVALVLDNTYSMSADTGGGVSRLKALKTASTGLIDALLDDDGNVRIAVVPYAQYVNVGTNNANASWLSKEFEGSRQEVDKSAVTTTSGQCEQKKDGIEKSCPTGYNTTKTTYWGCDTKDGIQVNCRDRTSSTKKCDVAEVETQKYKEVCPADATYKTVTYKWYGCVYSRFGSTTARLNDGEATVKYPGFTMSDPNAKDPNCLTPILPLTTSEKDLKAAIDALSFSKGSHEPNTYIPGGLVWGQNVLSHSEPFTEAADYDPTGTNRAPRKIMILMTDGDNTLVYQKSNGTHTTSTNVTTTNNDTKALCDYSKGKKIELYTVSFMVTNAVAKTLLENCATDKAHYYDASDTAQLLSAFRGIADAISKVRIAK